MTAISPPFIHDGRGKLRAASVQVLQAAGLLHVENGESSQEREVLFLLLAGVRGDRLGDRPEEDDGGGLLTFADVAPGLLDGLEAAPPPAAVAVLHADEGEDQNVDPLVAPESAQAQG